MFLSVEWAKRWLPAVFLLLSLFLPWWTLVGISGWLRVSRRTTLDLSFSWGDDLILHYDPTVGYIVADYEAHLSHIPYLFFVSALITVAGLCGLSSKSRTRTLGGLLGIAGVVSYLFLVLEKESFQGVVWLRNPYFGLRHGSVVSPASKAVEPFYFTCIWFLSAGFYLAITGSLMLLLPLIRTLIERLRKRL